MATPKVLHGARAIVSVVNPNTNGGTKQADQRVLGIWDSFSYSESYDVSPVFILGRFSAAELVTTGYEPVTINCSGYRILDHSIQTEGAYTELANLLLQEGVTLTVIDRQTNRKIATILGCVPTGASTSMSAKQLFTQQATYMGLRASDELFTNTESSTSSDLP